METQQRNSVKEFLETATAKEVSEFVGLLEKNTCLVEAHNNFIQLVKMAAFVKMETELEIHRHTWKGKNSKRYPTELLLHSKSKEVTLFISSKDSHDLNSMYVRLYDEHKDKLLNWIDSKDSSWEKLDADLDSQLHQSETAKMTATLEKVKKLAREFPGPAEDRDTIVNLAMLMLQYPTDYVDAVLIELQSAAQEVQQNSEIQDDNMRQKCDVEDVLLELAAGMTIEALGEWKESVNVISKEKGYDPQGKMALMFKEVIDTTIKGKQKV